MNQEDKLRTDALIFGFVGSLIAGLLVWVLQDRHDSPISQEEAEE